MRLPKKLMLLTALWVPAGLAWAQATPPAAPDSRAMIEALKPTMRNLTIRPMPAPVPTPASGEPSAMSTPSLPQAPAAALAPAPTAMPTPPAFPAPPVVPAAPGPAPGNKPGPAMSLAIQFEMNSSRVRPESGAVLGNLVFAMQSPELKDSRFVIEGHTDARGSSASNLKLSQDRADEVRLYLIALGVHPARLKALGKGGGELANAADPLSAENRRVRVVTLE